MILCLYIIDTIYSLLFFAFIIHLAAGYTFNNYFTFNMGQFPKNAGIAGGLIGGIVYIIVSLLTSMILFVIPAKDQQNLSLSYLILIVLSLLIMYVILKTNRKDLDI